MSTRASLVYKPWIGLHIYHDVVDNEVHVEVLGISFVLRHEVADWVWPGVRFAEQVAQPKMGAIDSLIKKASDARERGSAALLVDAEEFYQYKRWLSAHERFQNSALSELGIQSLMCKGVWIVNQDDLK